LVKGQRTVLVIEQINIDASVDILSQINDYFHELMNQIKRNDNNIELFFPGGGDIQLPDFFRQFCEENNIHCHFIGFENYQNYADFL
jgi:exopolysaccharide biosynthesis predicted pyruvyltransferase EpsI